MKLFLETQVWQVIIIFFMLRAHFFLYFFVTIIFASPLRIFKKGIPKGFSIWQKPKGWLLILLVMSMYAYNFFKRRISMEGRNEVWMRKCQDGKRHPFIIMQFLTALHVVSAFVKHVSFFSRQPWSCSAHGSTEQRSHKMKYFSRGNWRSHFPFSLSYSKTKIKTYHYCYCNKRQKICLHIYKRILSLSFFELLFFFC